MCSERKLDHASKMQCEVWVEKHSQDPWTHFMCSKDPTRKEPLNFLLAKDRQTIQFKELPNVQALFLLNKPVPWKTGYKLVCLQSEIMKHLSCEHG